MSEPTIEDMTENRGSDEDLVEKVRTARKRQKERFKGAEKLNAFMNDRETELFCGLSGESRNFLKKLIPKDLPVSDYFKILRVARTLADLEDSDDISPQNLKEAFSFSERGRVFE